MSKMREYFDLVTKAIFELPEEKIANVISILKSAVADDKQVFIFGNGGSASTSAHLACDYQKGVKEATGKKFRCTSLSDNVALMTAWSNDTSYENIFAEQIDSLLKPGDVVIAISGSGNSKNVLNAVEKANEMGAITIGWSGFKGGKLAEIAQNSIVINSDSMQRIEDVHLILGHLVFVRLMDECK